MWGQHVSLQEPRNKYVCRFCKLRLFAHVLSLGSNHGMHECIIMSWPTLMTKTLIIEICKPNRV